QVRRGSFIASAKPDTVRADIAFGQNGERIGAVVQAIDACGSAFDPGAWASRHGQFRPKALEEQTEIAAFDVPSHGRGQCAAAVVNARDACLTARDPGVRPGRYGQIRPKGHEGQTGIATLDVALDRNLQGTAPAVQGGNA